jgi:N-acyl-D-amino-acid deacylase
MKSKPNWIIIIFLTGLLLLLTATSYAQSKNSYDYDVLIRGGKVFEGSLKPAFGADIAIKNDKIVKVAKSVSGTAERIINAKGLFITPGFIDMHSHVQQDMVFPGYRACLNYLYQGVTSVVIGHCGESGWPIYEKAEDQIKRWTEEGIGPNAALLVGHNYTRELVMGFDDRDPTKEELEKMKALVKEAMDQGATGISTGLNYRPGKYAQTEEVIELAKVIAPYGGVYYTHIRNEEDKHLAAVKEAIEIGEKAGIPVHISHFKIKGFQNWGKLKDSCEEIENARDRGLKVTADIYPYRFVTEYPYRELIPAKIWLGDLSDEVLTIQNIKALFNDLNNEQLIALYNKIDANSLISDSYQQYIKRFPRERLINYIAYSIIKTRFFHGPENQKERALFLNRLNDPEEAIKIRENLRNFYDARFPADNVVIARCVEKNLEGKTLKEVARIKGKTIEDTAIELGLMNTLVIRFSMSEKDVEYAMNKDYMATGSDGLAVAYGVGLTHIRSYSTFLNRIKKYAQEKKIVSVEHTIRSQTSLAAQIMNWNDRGWVKEGYIADIAIIDMDNIEIGSSIHNPHVYCKGVNYLLIGGELAIDNGKYTGKLPGKIIKNNLTK